MLAVDHVIVAVEDLDAAARHYEDEYGLASLVGGRHPGHGTGNRIVPLGDSYIELMALVDRHEAAASPLGSWLARRLVQVGEGPAGLCVRTDDLVAAARRTGNDPLRMSRTRPDGVELAWRLVAIDGGLTHGLPFFIEWKVDDVDHPGRQQVGHRRPPAGIDWVEFGGDQEQLAAWLGAHDLPLRPVDGAPGPHRIGLAMADGEPVIIA